jgi:hypothetical protein
MRKCSTVKKDYRFSSSQPGCHQPKSPWPGIIKLFTARETLVSDIGLETGKMITFFTVYDRKLILPECLCARLHSGDDQILGVSHSEMFYTMKVEKSKLLKKLKRS